MAEKTMSHQEYLKRYILSDESKKKTKKKKPKIPVPVKKITGLKIIDDDVDFKAGDNNDFIDECGEDAPVVAEIIDERPLSVQNRESRGPRWKQIGASDEENSREVIPQRKRHDSDSDLSPGRVKAAKISEKNNKIVDSDGDFSPPRSNQVLSKNHKEDSSIHRSLSKKNNWSSKKHKYQNSDSDHSPPRKKEVSRKTFDNSGSDLSPYRKKDQTSARVKKKNSSIDDQSPVRKRKLPRNDSDSDISLPRKGPSSLKTHIRNAGSDSDFSPPRVHKSNSRSSHMRNRNDSDSDLSPKRSSKRSSSIQKSSLERTRTEKYSKNAEQKLKKNVSPLRRRRERSSSRDSEPPPTNRKMAESRDAKFRPSTTLSGLTAGLQNASTLRAEAKVLRKKENKQILEMDHELSGRNAQTIHRNRETGEKIDLKQVQKKKEEHDKKEAEKKAKYSDWGKGLEQRDEQLKKFEDDVYEMSKPLARYKDDEDLDRELKSRLHEEDPMFEYMKKKKKKEENLPEFPKYSGPPPPINRFNILPGYRWDGVDRSNGFEKRYFEKINKAKAQEIESHLWSVQDM